MNKLLELLEAAKNEAAKLLSTQRQGPQAERAWLQENYNIPGMRHDMNRFGHLLCWTQEQQKAFHRYEQLTDEQNQAQGETPQQELERLRRQYDLAGMERTLMTTNHLQLWREDCQEAYHRAKELERWIAGDVAPNTETLTVDLTYLEAVTLRELLRRVVPAGFCANDHDAVHMTSAIAKLVKMLDDE